MAQPTDIMATRYTAKKYDASRRVSKEELHALLEAARLAPTSVNAQLTRYWVADTPEAIEALLPSMVDFNRERVASASAVIVLGVLEQSALEPHLQKVLAKEIEDGKIADPSKADVVDAGRRHFVGLHTHSQEAYVAWATQQAYISLGMLMLLSAQMGIDSTALEGLEYEVLTQHVQASQPTWRPVVALALGYRASDDKNFARPKSRLAFDDVISFLE